MVFWNDDDDDDVDQYHVDKVDFCDHGCTDCDYDDFSHDDGKTGRELPI